MNKPEFISIFNDILGPVMRGPSSSHTAGSYHIAKVGRALLGEQPVTAVFSFDPDGSYAATYRQQNADKAFAAGLMEWDLTDDRFGRALDVAAEVGLDIRFRVVPLDGADHPNTVKVDLAGRSGRELHALAKSTGGGGFLVQQIGDWPVSIDGKSYETFVMLDKNDLPGIEKILNSVGEIPQLGEDSHHEAILLSWSGSEPIPGTLLQKFEGSSCLKAVWTAQPVFYVQKGTELFRSAEEMVQFAAGRQWTLGQAALHNEAQLLGMGLQEVKGEMARRYQIMAAAVELGLREDNVRMKFLKPSAGQVMDAEKAGSLAVGGIHARAAAGALSVLHMSNSGGVICAAPTGGSSGVIPGVVTALAGARGMDPDQVGLALFAAGAIGLVIARRATFAAEVAGCQVEIGAAGAMAAAGVVEAAGGSARQAVNAAAIALQNTMGSVCDLVQGSCEIPCHTRNAVAASSAFTCADLVLGGYRNPIPLDETIDAAFAAGKMLPPELLCTSQGGLAVTPSAMALGRAKKN
jgi:L-serine dehydratase